MVQESSPNEPQGNADSAPTRRLEIPAEWSGLRLDRALGDVFPEQSRTRLQAWIKAGCAALDEQPVLRPGHVLEAGQALVVTPPAMLEKPPSDPRDPRLAILFEDDAVAVIDKPAGLVVHSDPGSGRISLSDLAVARFGDLPDPHGEGRPGIVHRLDRQTSGVIVLAKTELAAVSLLEQFKSRRVSKHYTALVHGTPRFDSDWLTAPIARSARNPERMTTVDEGEGRSAETFYTVLERFCPDTKLAATLLRVEPKTGRTHQIRVHLESIDLPIAGDTVYRGRGAARTASQAGLGQGIPAPRRQFLHAARLEFEHPTEGRRAAFEAPLASDLAACLDALRRRAAADEA